MKNIRKFFAVILCVAMMMTVCVPFASADESGKGITDITQESPETEIPDTDITVSEELEKEDTYSERLRHCFKGGLQNLMNAGLFLTGTALSPVTFFVFPPIAVALGLIGVPISAASLFVGIGEIIASPILAFFFDTNDYMGLI
ncbi:MAG: hypothetical protein IKB88_09630 [Clostridia bacterium]|nr:hypothetical protein [Clostridia bacterium]